MDMVIYKAYMTPQVVCKNKYPCLQGQLNTVQFYHLILMYNQSARFQQASTGEYGFTSHLYVGHWLLNYSWSLVILIKIDLL